MCVVIITSITEHSGNLSWGGTCFLRCGLVCQRNSSAAEWPISQWPEFSAKLLQKNE